MKSVLLVLLLIPFTIFEGVIFLDVFNNLRKVNSKPQRKLSNNTLGKSNIRSKTINRRIRAVK